MVAATEFRKNDTGISRFDFEDLYEVTIIVKVNITSSSTTSSQNTDLILVSAWLKML